MSELSNEAIEEMLMEVYDRLGDLNRSTQELLDLASKLKAAKEGDSDVQEGEDEQLPLNLESRGTPTLFDNMCGGIADTDFVSKLQVALGITQQHPQWDEAAYRILYALEACKIVKFIEDGDERIVLWVDVDE